MSNTIRFYVFKAVTPGGVYSLKFLPYDATKFDLMGPIQKMPQFQDEILRAMQKSTDGYTPMYNKNKSVQENLQDLHDHLGYWPIPLTHKYVYEDIRIKYDKDLGPLDGPESIKHTWDEEIPF